MAQAGLENLVAEIAALRPVCPVGRITTVEKGAVKVAGLSADARIGDLVQLCPTSENPLAGEVIGIGDDIVTVLSEGDTEGLAVGDRVILSERSEIAPDDSWIGRVIDPTGRPLDGRPILRGQVSRPLRTVPPSPTARRGLGARLDTGLSVFNTLLPLVRGQRIGLFAGSGVGKSTLLAMLTQGLAADVVVIALIGERGRELRDFVTKVLGPDGMKRAVIVAATADRSPLQRRRCAWTAMTVAEHFRDQGNHVLLLADSVTRFAEAHREIALAAGEAGSLRGFPPSTAHIIPALCERAGPGLDGMGDITAVFSVLVAGSDMDEPISDLMRGVLDGHVVLDRSIAERGRFPAIDLLRSVSRSLPDAASDQENQFISEARRLMGAYARAELMIQAGLYEAGSDAEIDRAIAAHPLLDAFMGRHEHHGVTESFKALRLIIAPDEVDQSEADAANRAPGNEIDPEPRSVDAAGPLMPPLSQRGPEARS